MATTRQFQSVIFVDDSPDDIFLVKWHLEKAGLKNPMITFDDGESAAAFLKDVASTPESALMPCVIFTDVKMPRMNGFELLRWVRHHALLKAVPVYMLSSSADPRDIKKAESLGCSRYFTKFPTTDVFKVIIEDRCERRASLLPFPSHKFAVHDGNTGPMLTEGDARLAPPCTRYMDKSC